MRGLKYQESEFRSNNFELSFFFQVEWLSPGLEIVRLESSMHIWYLKSLGPPMSKEMTVDFKRLADQEMKLVIF